MNEHQGKEGELVACWRVCVDTGGTFTDCLAVDPRGRTHRAKVLSSSALRGRIVEVENPRQLRLEAAWRVGDDFFVGCAFRALRGSQCVPVVGFEAARSQLTLEADLPGLRPGDGFEIRSPEEAPVLAARWVTQTPHGQPLPPLRLRLATTRGTNALLERRGAPTALLVTRGFADLWLIGTQQRPDLFALEVRKRRPLYSRVVEIEERLAADGSIVRPLDEAVVAEQARQLVADGIQSVAVALLHSYRNPAHELASERLLLAAGVERVAVSSRLAPLIRILPRAETALVDAYLAPVIGDYLERVASAVVEEAGGGGEGIGAGSVHVMTSAGGLVRADSFNAKDSLLSGPAGGVVGAVSAGRASGFEALIAFDMGGTSTDVSRFGGGEMEYVYEHQVGDAHLVAPALAIETVAAGGGSICGFDGHRLSVGPQSAGADPGPACYGAGGPLTVTDVNLLLGRLDSARFGIPIDLAAAHRAASALAQQIAGQEGKPLEPLLAGLLAIANERMADAIRTISLRLGYAPEDHALVAFGGAGGQHACAVAELLGIGTVLVPADAGLLSAVGLGHAVVERFAQRQVLRPWSEVAPQLERWLGELAEQARGTVAEEGIANAEILVRQRRVSLRLQGQESAIEVDARGEGSVLERFTDRYRALYGYPPGDRPVEVESLRVVASSRPEEAGAVAVAEELAPPPAEGVRRLWLEDGWQEEVPLYSRSRLLLGTTFGGPALVAEEHSATLVHAGWRVQIDGSGCLVLSQRIDGCE